MKKFRNRAPNGKDRGSAIAEILIGVAVGIIILGGGAMFFATVSQNNANNSALQIKNTSISEALDRTTQQIQVAGTILTAGPDELVITSPENGTDEQVITRWVKAGSTFYQQTWAGAANAYPFTEGTWIPVTAAGAVAPNGDGKQVTRESVTGLSSSAPAIFTYYGADSTALSVSPALSAQDGGTNAIKRVEIHLQADVGGAGMAENSASAALRNVTGGVSDGNASAPNCPVVSFDTREEAFPVIRWTVIPGFTDYVIYRNSSFAAGVSVYPNAAGQAMTVGEWSDTASPVAPGDAVTYAVYAKSADGSLTPGCRPGVWRAQVAAASWKDTAVLPSNPEAAGWSAGPHAALTAPRIVLDWNTVDGASGYELNYREVDPATGLPVPGAEGFSPAPGYNPESGAVTYTWDGGGWGKRYEWFVKSSSLSGQSRDSSYIQTLTHPAAPRNPAVKAEYGTGATKATQGRNVLTWDASPTATSYEVWRYELGKDTGTAARVTTTPTRSFTDTVDYGTEFTYYVVAKNDGPRGGSDGTRSSPTPEAAVTGSDLPKKSTQLQYPPVPGMVPVGPDGTRDLQGSNRIMWNAVTSANGYLGWKRTDSGTVSCLVKDCEGLQGTTSVSLNDTVPAGSQFEYYVKAYNDTGVSVDFSAMALVTQRPAVPALQVTRSPDLASPAASFAVKPNGDAGNAAKDSFCTENSCTYQLLKNGSTVATYGAKDSQPTVVWTNIPNADGATVGYTARSRNAALTNDGWSDAASTTVNTYPGAFGVLDWVGDSGGRNTQRFNLDLRSIAIEGSSHAVMQDGQSTLSWGGSAGAVSFFLQRVSLAHDTTGAPGMPWKANLATTAYSGNSGIWTEPAAPGATYKYEITARAANGLERPVLNRASFTTPADMPREGKQIVVCSAAAWNVPQKVAARLIDFQHTPRYGAWSSVTVKGLDHIAANNSTAQESASYGLGRGASPQLLSGQGSDYYRGHTFGHDLWTVGDNGPNSARLRLSIVTMAQHGDGCGPAGVGGESMREPIYPCYGYVEGVACQAVNEHNRPRWITR